MAGEEPRVAQAYIEIKARRAGTREDVKRIGEEFGREAGGTGGEKFDDEFGKRVKSPTSRRNRQEEGRQLGDILGQAAGAAAGRHVADSTRAAVRLELKAAAREARVAERAAAAEARQAAQQVKAAERASAQAEAAFRARMARIQKLGDRIGSGISRPILGGSGITGKLTSVVGVGATAASLSGLGTVTAGTVSAVTALSGLVGPLGAGLAAAGVGAGTLAIGIHGVGDAIADSGDLEKFNEDIKGLSPNARAFAMAVRGLRGDLGKLQNSVQDGLFAGLDTDVKSLADRYLPLAEKGLTRVSKAMNAGARDVAGFLDTKGAQGQVGSILDSIGASAEKLQPALRPATQALLDFVEVGSESLPGLSDDMTHLSERFSRFIRDAKDSGDLHDFFEGGIEAGRDLLDVTKNVGRTFGGIFKAGATGDSSGLKTLADLTDRIADQVNKPEFQAGLRDFFGAFKDAGGSFGDALPEVADALIALEPAAAKFVRGSGVALADIMEDGAAAAKDLAPFLNTLGDVFESVAPHAGELLAAFLLLKGGLLGLKVADSILTGYDLLAGRFDRVTTAGGRMNSVVGGRGFLASLGTAAAVVGVAAVADEIGAASGRADVATVKIKDLASAVGELGKGGELGEAGLKVLGTGGLFGLIKNPANDSADALDKFGTAAYNALDKGWDARLGRWQSFGQAQGAFKKQTQQLDGAFSDLASHGQIEGAATSFEKFLKAGKDAGVPVASLKAQFPEFSARLKAAGLTVDDTTGKVTNLDGALRSLPNSKTVKIQGLGFVQAITSAEVLRDRLRNIPKNVIARVQTQYIDVFASEVAHDNARAHNHGPFTGGRIGADGTLARYNSGGLVDWRLGGPRQDNVPILVSGREFVVNAYATGQPGVLDWLKTLNTENRLPRFADGGSVTRQASAGLNDLTVSQTLNRTVRTTHPDDAPAQGGSSTARLHPDDIAALGRVLAAAVREQQVVLSDGALAGAVRRQAGATW